MPGTSSLSSRHSPIFKNYVLVSAVVAVLISQSVKFFLSWYKERRFDLKWFVWSGGMPSSHSAIVTALATAIGLQDGLGSSEFAMALIFACIVMYDATGVRLQAGRQAEVLNRIVYGLPADHPLAESTPLRELLGHTPLQVIVGCLLGILTAFIGKLIVRVQ
ncbi:hypothetical protein SAY87_001725 [Trapa incisa]|uniref:Acid phosphatase/vanadium-dependent haloperoxidase-related protein n=2 Tax=Trapa TaxID=22665 RepID=A0AAN7KLY6_TRANT|nr:hypothetical protein SAY87_001725 [Trapa incisa]KAK4765502.1 hypothetical protein SAY86_026592 [Trapa natans]